MRFLLHGCMLGGLAVVLGLSACSTASPDRATLPDATATAARAPVTVLATAAAATGTAARAPVTVPATAAAATDTATLVPAAPAPAYWPLASLPVAASPSIRSLFMLGLYDGWALTDTDVLRTQDGGDSWYKATPASLNGAPVAPCFWTPATAWLAAMGADPTTGTLYHTEDGGGTWTSTTVPFGGGSIIFDDNNDGWELIGLSAGMSHEAVAIYRTSDGGATWSRVFTDDPSIPGSSDSLPLVGDKNGITAINNRHAWVTGAQPSPDFIYVYATLDGGKTWTHQDLSIPAAYKGAMTSPSQPVFLSGIDAVLPVLLFANTNGSVFYVSHDGGRSWSATTPVPQGGFLAVASPTDFYVWDGSAPLFASHDAGVTWSTITPNINIKDSMASMQFVGYTGWALTADANGHRTLYRTDDGGVTWTVLIP
jgi:photosystem II stability/assembly factor-like uncharacterized protein